jgi:hypothetical protein
MDSAISSVLAAQHASVSDQVSMTVLRKTMDAQQEEGAQIVAMIAQAGQAGSPKGGGAQGLDLYA